MNAIVLTILLVSGIPAAEADAPATADAEQSVESGRKSLSRTWPTSYPWYDSASDDVRRIAVRKPRKPWNPNVNFPTGLVEWLFWIVIAIALLFLIYVLVQTFLQRSKMPPPEAPIQIPRDPADFERVEALPFPVRVGKLDLFDEAREQYLQGDYAAAVVYLFSYQLVELDKHHLIRLTKGKTNRQYLREVKKRKPLHRLVEQTMVAFEDVFFGNRSLDQARFEAIWSRVGEFSSLAAQGGV